MLGLFEIQKRLSPSGKELYSRSSKGYAITSKVITENDFINKRYSLMAITEKVREVCEDYPEEIYTNIIYDNIWLINWDNDYFKSLLIPPIQMTEREVYNWKQKILNDKGYKSIYPQSYHNINYKKPHLWCELDYDNDDMYFRLYKNEKIKQIARYDNHLDMVHNGGKFDKSNYKNFQ